VRTGDARLGASTNAARASRPCERTRAASFVEDEMQHATERSDRKSEESDDVEP
jgi:hypothetical protein